MAILRGTTRDDFLNGTGISDQLFGFAGDDILFGRGGKDSLFGGSGSDVLYGHAGDDRLDGGTGGDLIDGGEGVDTLLPATGFEGIEVNLRQGYAAMDGEFDALAAIENVVGTAGADNLSGNAATNLLQGLGGDDSLGGDGGNDRLLGGEGSDSLSGDDDNDRLLGDGGDDSIDGGNGDDQLFGGAAIDFLFGGPGRDRLNGALGDDELDGGPGNDLLQGGSGDDSFGYGAFLFESTDELSASGRDLAVDFHRTSDAIAVSNLFPSPDEGEGFIFFEGDELFQALDSNRSGRLDGQDAFVDIREVSFAGEGHRSTVLDLGGLIADAAQFGDYVAGTAQLTVLGVTGLTSGDIFGI